MADRQDISPKAATPPGNGSTERVLTPDTDIFEDTDAITVAIDLPGVRRDALQINVDKQSLTIDGTSQMELPSGMQPLHAEVRSRHYRRSFTLSTELESERIEANLKDGVLSLRIPKRAEVKPRRIDVRVQ